MPDFIAAKCPSCGARLDVYGDMTSFSCAHCGNAVVANRRGGTISLSLEESFRAVATNTDRTAAELALLRLEKELAEATAWANSLEKCSRSFNPQDLMNEGDADAAGQRVNWLRAELKAHENDFRRTNDIMHALALLVIIGCGVYSFTRQGFFAILGTLVLSVPLGLLFVFLLSIAVEFISEAPGSTGLPKWRT